MILERETFLKNPIFKSEFIFSSARKREKEIYFEEKISLREEKKIFFIKIPLKQKINIFLRPWELLNFKHLYEHGIEEDILINSLLNIDRVYESMNLIKMSGRFYIENGHIFVTEITGVRELREEEKVGVEDFLEKYGNSYIFSDDWFAYCLFGNQLSLEGLTPSIIFFRESLEVFSDLSKAKPRVFIVKKNTFEQKFVKEKKEKNNIYFYIYDTQDKNRGNIVTAEGDIEEIPKIIKR